MARFPLTPSSLQEDENAQAATGRLLNVYVDRTGSPERTRAVYRSTLGTESFASLSNLFVRSMDEINGLLYVVSDNSLFSIDMNGAPTTLGTVVGSDDAQVFGDGSNVCVVSGGRYYFWDGTTLSEPTGGAFSEFGSGVFLSNYVVLAEEGGRRFLWSDLTDGSTLPALNFSTADGDDDKIVRLMTANGRLLIMKERTIEVWYNTGGVGAEAFKRVAGGVMEIGLKARKLVTKTRGGVFWIGDDGVAYISSGAGAQPVTGDSPAFEAALKNSDPTEVFFWEDRGHKFCATRFSDRPAWVYNFSSGSSYERSFGVNHAPWTARASAKAFGNWYVGDDLGQISKLTRNNADVGAPLRRTIVSQPLYNEGDPFRVTHLKVSGRVGFSDLGRDAEWSLEVSPDGVTYDREETRSMGDVGQYQESMEWYGLGWFDEMAVFRLSTSEPADLTLNVDAQVKVA